MSLDDFDRFWLNIGTYVDERFEELLDFIEKGWILISGDSTLIPAITYAIFPRQTYEWVRTHTNGALTKEDYEEGKINPLKLNYLQINMLPENPGINFPLFIWKRDRRVKDFFNFTDFQFNNVMHIVFKKQKDIINFETDFEKGLTLRNASNDNEIIIANLKNIPDTSMRLYCYPKSKYLKNAKRFLNNVKNDFLERFPNIKG